MHCFSVGIGRTYGSPSSESRHLRSGDESYSTMPLSGPFPTLCTPPPLTTPSPKSAAPKSAESWDGAATEPRLSFTGLGCKSHSPRPSYYNEARIGHDTALQGVV
eukprot:15433600-Alexandrium_andersonii.AAC.3